MTYRNLFGTRKLNYEEIEIFREKIDKKLKDKKIWKEINLLIGDSYMRGFESKKEVLK